MRTILIVDDDRAFAEIVRGALDKNAYEVTNVTDGIQALESIKTARPDLILLDIKMPGMDGIEFLRRLKDTKTSPAIPVIILSNDPSLDTISQGTELGAQSYILKSDESLDKIVELIEKQFAAK